MHAQVEKQRPEPHLAAADGLNSGGDAVHGPNAVNSGAGDRGAGTPACTTPSPTSKSPSVATPASSGKSHLGEEAVNYNTLYMPAACLGLRALAEQHARSTCNSGEPSQPGLASGTQVAAATLSAESSLGPTHMVQLQRRSTAERWGLVLSSDPLAHPTITSINPGGVAAAAAERGELALGMQILRINGQLIFGHDEGTRVLVGSQSDAMLELRSQVHCSALRPLIVFRTSEL